MGDKSQAAIVKDIQRHPAKNVIMHMDFQRVVDDVKIKMNVPIHLIGGDDSVGVRDGGGSVSHLKTDVEVSCLPKDLPEYFELDISSLGLDEMMHLSDIKLPEGVEMPELALGPEHDQAIVSIHVIKVAVVEEEVEEAEGIEGEAAEGAEDASAEDTPAGDSDGESTEG